MTSMPSLEPNDTVEPSIEFSDAGCLVQRPVVSVLMLAYNHDRYLAEAIESVLTQQVDFPIELLIGEDCSTDASREIALRYQRMHPSVVRVITSSRNVGVRYNVQRLVAASRGRFIAHIDGDDYWFPEKLRRQVAYMDAHQDCAAVYTNALTLTEVGAPVGIFNDAGSMQFDLAYLLRRGNFLNMSSMLFRSEAKQALLGIDGPFIDYRVHLLHARRGFLAHLEQPLVAYRTNATGSMISTSNDLVRSLYWEAITSVPRDLVSDGDYARGLADFLRRVIFRAVRTRRLQLPREWVPQVFKASPYGVTRTSLLVAAAILRASWVEVAGLLRTGPDGRRIKVMYRH